MCQYWLTNSNKCTPFMHNVKNWGSGYDLDGSSVLSLQCFCKSRTVLKYEVYFLKWDNTIKNHLESCCYEMAINDNETEKALFTQVAYKEKSIWSNSLRRPVSLEAGIPRAWTRQMPRFHRRGIIILYEIRKVLFPLEREEEAE